MYNNYHDKPQTPWPFLQYIPHSWTCFLTIGMVTDQTAFSWIAIAFVVISLISGGKWLRPRK